MEIAYVISAISFSFCIFKLLGAMKMMATILDAHAERLKIIETQPEWMRIKEPEEDWEVEEEE